jgi:hypothetical protein
MVGIGMSNTGKMVCHGTQIKMTVIIIQATYNLSLKILAYPRLRHSPLTLLPVQSLHEHSVYYNLKT